MKPLDDESSCVQHLDVLTGDPAFRLRIKMLNIQVLLGDDNKYKPGPLRFWKAIVTYINPGVFANYIQDPDDEEIRKTTRSPPLIASRPYYLCVKTWKL